MNLDSPYKRKKSSIQHSDQKDIHRRSKANAMNVILQEDDEPLEPIESGYGLEQMITGFIERDADQFLNNFWFVFLSKYYHKCTPLTYNKRDATCDAEEQSPQEFDRCINRRISSGYCYISDDWWAKIPFFEIPEEKRGQRDWCINVQEPTLLQNAKKVCSSPLTDPHASEVEAFGCDGYTQWVWCNKPEYSGGGFDTGDGNLDDIFS